MEQFLNKPSSNELQEIRSHFSQSHTSSGLFEELMFLFFSISYKLWIFEEFLLPFSISYKLGIVEEMQRFKRKMEKLGDGMIRKKKLWIQTLSLIVNVKKKNYFREERWSSVT
jgi:hypothetical protein